MSAGKYSPTVWSAYRTNQEWFERYSKGEVFDPEGYDSYGYNEQNLDREGRGEWAYDSAEEDHLGFSLVSDTNYAWTFDGVKPVRRAT